MTLGKQIKEIEREAAALDELLSEAISSVKAMRNGPEKERLKRRLIEECWVDPEELGPRPSRTSWTHVEWLAEAERLKSLARKFAAAGDREKAVTKYLKDADAAEREGRRLIALARAGR